MLFRSVYGVARLRFVGTGVLGLGSDLGVLDLGVWVCGLDSLKTEPKKGTKPLHCHHKFNSLAVNRDDYADNNPQSTVNAFECS